MDGARHINLEQKLDVFYDHDDPNDQENFWWWEKLNSGTITPKNHSDFIVIESPVTKALFLLGSRQSD